MSRQRVVVTTLVASIAFISGGWLMQQTSQPERNVYQQARMFDDVLSHVAEFYVDSLDERQLYRMAIDGMLGQLHDPYTGYLDGRELRSLSEQTTGNYGGVGLQIEYRDGAIVVVSPLPDSPAERAGMRTGDRIVQVGDSATARWSQEKAVGALRGRPGTNVVLKVERPGIQDPITYDLVRAEIHARSVRLAAILGDGVGYVELFNFSESTARELKQAIDSLKREGMQSLILDLRWNPGGLLDEGVQVSDLFLDPGQQIVTTRGRTRNSNREFTDREAQPHPTLPLVVLTNGATASAAEIVAGALQDHDRAVIVGTTSYGKGVVQSVFQLSNAASLKMTTSKWFTPSGRSIQRRHQDDTRDPDAEIARTDSAARADSVYRTDRGRVVRGGGGVVPDMVVEIDSAEIRARTLLQQALGPNVVKYTDALAAFALSARARQLVPSPTFTVTPAMREQFLALLVQRGVRLDQATINATWPFISKQLGGQVARFAFGRAGEIVRLAATGDDPVLSAAKRLASRSRSPAELLTLVQAPLQSSSRP